MAVLRLKPGLDPRRVGGKCAALGAVSGRVRVPDAVCLTVDELERALSDVRIAALADLFEDMRATVGAFFVEDRARIQDIVSELHLAGSQHDAVMATIRDELGDLASSRFAVRSSASDEDGVQRSRAGVYRSILGVSGEEELALAISACWRSYYGAPAVAARLRDGDHDARPRMAVMVQRLVEPEIAGVAFTDGAEHTRLEWVEGSGEALVSGTAEPSQATLGPGDRDAPVGAVAAARAARTLRAAAGHDVDVEWTYADEALSVVQVRPLTTPLDGAVRRREPFFAGARLYLDAELPARMEIGDVADVYSYYVSKRATAFRLADASGVRVGAAHVVAANGLGLHSEPGREWLGRLLGATPTPQVVVDAGPALRQIILTKREVYAELADLMGLAAGDATVRAAIIRDFVVGSHGAISRHLGDDVLVELSEDGLMGLNRGTCASTQVVVGLGAEPAMDEALRDAVGQIVHFTRAATTVMPDSQLEWAIDGGEAVFVDFSRIRSEIEPTIGQTTMVSSGVAQGPLVTLDVDSLLTRLSIGPAVSVDCDRDVLEHRELGRIAAWLAEEPIKPIVLVRRPYAVLSTLFEHVAGFVFLEGSLLCHLAILLREAKLPAVIDPSPPRVGDALIADGRLSVMSANHVPR